MVMSKEFKGINDNFGRRIYLSPGMGSLPLEYLIKRSKGLLLNSYLYPNYYWDE
jgi:hypothetical protein